MTSQRTFDRRKIRESYEEDIKQCPEFTKDLRAFKRTKDQRAFDYEKHMAPIKGLWVAGGAVLSRITKSECNDIDLYVDSDEALQKTVYFLMHKLKARLVYATDKALTFTVDARCRYGKPDSDTTTVQLIYYKYHRTPYSIFDSFDFSVCKVAYCPATRATSYAAGALHDIAARELKVQTGGDFPISSLMRVQKYQKKGWFISKAEHLKLVLHAINGGMPTSWLDLSRAIGGVYGKEVAFSNEGTPFSFDAAMKALSDFDFDDLPNIHPYRYSSIELSDVLRAVLDVKAKQNAPAEEVSNVGQVELTPDPKWVLGKSADGGEYLFNMKTGDLYPEYPESMPSRAPDAEVDSMRKDMGLTPSEGSDLEGDTSHWWEDYVDLPKHQRPMTLEEAGIVAFRSYKFVCPDLTPQYKNPFGKTRNDIHYEVGRTIEETDPPYLFSGKVKSDVASMSSYAGKNGRNHLIQVEIKPEDLMVVSKSMVQARQLKVVADYGPAKDLNDTGKTPSYFGTVHFDHQNAFYPVHLNHNVDPNMVLAPKFKLTTHV